MRYAVLVIGALAVSGCVAAQNIVVDKQAFAAYTCPQLELELVKLGGLKSRASNNQSMATGTQVAATILGGSVVNYANMKNAEKNERNAKAQLDNIYSIWDQKKCSEWQYQRNSANN